jgi:tetratricopeptide (TPR) repeat protein
VRSVEHSLSRRRNVYPAVQSVSAVFLAVCLLAGCQTKPAVAPATAPQAEAQVAALPPDPAVSVASRTPPSALERAQAQDRARAALSHLEKGEESLARAEFERALALDADNDLARRLRQEVAADPQREWGNTFFRYQVQPGDRLSDIAQRCVGDKFRFYSLARYNGMPDPRRLTAGQQIKIPGTNKSCVRPAEVSAKPVADAERPAPSGARKDAERAAALGAELQRKGDPDGAYRAYGDALRADPSYAEAGKQRDAVRAELVRRHERDANGAFQRQDLDRAIDEWDKVLALDPGNERARLNRSRALDLQQRLQAIPESK